MKLAIDGGSSAISHPLRVYRTIGPSEIASVTAAMNSGPLSGYLGGQSTGGLRVEALEHEWATAVGSKHAIACNSATSGLLMACHAVGVKKNSYVMTTPFTMSATAAMPKILGATLEFGQIEGKTFSLDRVFNTPIRSKTPPTIIVTNLFGHPAYLHDWRKVCDERGWSLIEDNAQAPFAREGDKYTGTIGHIGVFSLNVHKHLQCGEGGICVTDNDDYAERMRLFRNHGEMAEGPIGLNLRMTEVSAAIALTQLSRKEALMAGRVELAEELTHMAAHIPGVLLPTVREGCTHVYYCWTMVIEKDRDWFVQAMNAEGVPLRSGYVDPLYRLSAFASSKGRCMVAETLHDKTLCLFEVCAYDPSNRHRTGMKEAFKKVGEAYSRRRIEQC